MDGTHVRGHEIVEVVEGTTRILVPKRSVTERVPPAKPAFFNPKAKMNRDLSVMAYSSFVRGFHGPKILLDCMSGLGARGLRVANEVPRVERVVINDLNPRATEMAGESARLNGLENAVITGREACRLCGDFSGRDERASMVDIDPFGSPARFVDCGMRATMHGGILAVTATDLQVLNGLFQGACSRRYGGVPVPRVEYGNEIAIRLVLGCMRHIAARMDIEIVPVFVESDMHYYRAYVRILNRPDQRKNIGYVAHCRGCGDRRTYGGGGPETEIEEGRRAACGLCGSVREAAGPLWTGQLFEKGFVEGMAAVSAELAVHKGCGRVLSAAVLEAQVPSAAYYTLDEVASMVKTSPVRLCDAVDRLAERGFRASPTSLNPTGFRTDAPLEEVKSVFSV